MKTALLPLAFLSATLSQGFGAMIVNDTFADGDRTNGADVLDVSWFKGTTASTLAVVNDTTFGSNAMRYSGGSLAATVAAMPSTTLAVGETIRISVTFRYENGAPTNSAGAFRMGLFTNNGGETLGDTATVAADGSGHTADGYYASFPSGPAAAPTTTGNGYEIFRETEDNNAILAGDRSSLGAPTVTTAGMSGTGAYTALFEITRGASSTTFRSYLDAGTGTPTSQVGAGTDSSGTQISTFDTIALSIGGNNTPWLIDGVTVEVIPEPSAVLLGLLGGLSVLGVRRR